VSPATGSKVAKKVSIVKPDRRKGEHLTALTEDIYAAAMMQCKLAPEGSMLMERNFCDILNPYEVDLKETTAINFDVLSSWEFIRDVYLESLNAKDRIWAQAMTFELSHPTGVIDRILRSPKVVDKRLHVDHYTEITTNGIWNPQILFMPNQREELQLERRINQEVLEELVSTGVEKTILNRPKNILERVIPTKGRNHKKMMLIDKVAWMGKINFDDASFKDTVDFMIKVTDPKIVELLAIEFDRVNENRRTQDAEIICDRHTSLLIDCGKPGSSKILEEATMLVSDAAKSAQASLCFYPDGRFLTALHNAQKRGVEIKIVTSDPFYTRGLQKLANSYTHFIGWVTKRDIPMEYFPGYIHAAMVVVDGERAIAGSHNFYEKGVTGITGGTEEMAFLSDDSILVANVLNFLNRVL
jgi:cardiolipin synthase A/B